MTDTYTVSSCEGSCTVSVVISPEPVSVERVADMGLVFGLFMLAAIVIYFGRQMLGIFDRNPHGD